MMNDLIGKEIVGRYRIDSLVRETEIGDFYRGTNLVTGLAVTVKILAPAMAIDQRYVDRFLAEANAAADVSHPNILNILDVGTDTHILPFAVFEAIEGETLREVIRREGQLAQPRAIAVAKQVASALSAAHAKNLVHGGLNPDKIFIQTTDGVDTAKIFDFGVRSHAANSLEAVAYLAPEQSRSVPSTDARSDIYALGTIAYEMAAGETPFFGTTPSEVIRKQLNDLPPPLTAFRQDLHPQFEPIILSAIVADPETEFWRFDIPEALDVAALAARENSGQSVENSQGCGLVDGAKVGPYVEADSTCPINVYGASKTLGEQLVASANPRHLIVRTSWVISPFGQNFVKTMLRLAAASDRLNVVDDQHGAPTYAPHLAVAVLTLAEVMAGATADDSRWGIYHVTNRGEATWCGIARETFARAATHGFRAPEVLPIPSSGYPTPARRPANSRLDCTKLAANFGVSLPAWQDGVHHCVDRLLSAKQ